MTAAPTHHPTACAPSDASPTEMNAPALIPFGLSAPAPASAGDSEAEALGRMASSVDALARGFGGAWKRACQAAGLDPAALDHLEDHTDRLATALRGFQEEVRQRQMLVEIWRNPVRHGRR